MKSIDLVVVMIYFTRNNLLKNKSLSVKYQPGALKVRFNFQRLIHKFVFPKHKAGTLQGQQSWRLSDEGTFGRKLEWGGSSDNLELHLPAENLLTCNASRVDFY